MSLDACRPLRAQHRAPVKVVRALIAAYPEASAEPDGDGRLPLYLAAACRGADSSLVATLIRAHDRATTQPDAEGMLPLHTPYRMRHRRVVELLLHAAPAARCEIGGGLLPIHLAVAHHAPAESVRVLLRMFPESASWRTSTATCPYTWRPSTGLPRRRLARCCSRSPRAGGSARGSAASLQLVARRGIVETDAEDVTTRRSTRDDRGAPTRRS